MSFAEDCRHCPPIAANGDGDIAAPWTGVRSRLGYEACVSLIFMSCVFKSCVSRFFTSVATGYGLRFLK